MSETSADRAVREAVELYLQRRTALGAPFSTAIALADIKAALPRTNLTDEELTDRVVKYALRFGMPISFDGRQME